MPERDPTAVDVDLGGIELQLADAGDRLRCEGFVKLHEADLIDGETGAFEGFLRRGDRAQSHATGVYASDGGRYDASHCRPSPPFAALRRRYKQCSGPVVNAARARRGDGSILLDGRFQLR